jgi:hypothetical protein
MRLDPKLIRVIRKDTFYFLQKPLHRGVLAQSCGEVPERKQLDRSNRQHLLRMAKELGDARAFQQSKLAPASERLATIISSR